MLSQAMNKNGRVCTSANLAGTISHDGEVPPGPAVVVKDATGTVVATEDAPQVGGSYSQDVCTVPVSLGEIPASDFYEITVTGGYPGEQVTRT